MYLHQDRFAEALTYFQQALSIIEEIGYQANQATSLNSIETVYGSQGYFDEALKVSDQALTLSRANGDRKFESTILTNMRQSYLTRAFFFAGAPNVIATLWNVDDSAMLGWIGTLEATNTAPLLPPAGDPSRS